METPVLDTRRTGWTGAAERVISFWSLMGGVMVVAVVLMNVWRASLPSSGFRSGGISS